MIDGHPLVWLGVCGACLAAALTIESPTMLAILAAGLLCTGLLARGPRVASFVAACIATLGVAAWWLLCLAALPGPEGGPVLLRLPSASLGVGAQFGGAVTLAAVDRCVQHQLVAAVVLLSLGLAGQLVSVRGWRSLAALTGPLAPAFGWLAAGGEAAAEVAAARRQRRGSPGPSTLVTWLRACRDLSRDLPGVSPRVLLQWRLGDLWQAIATVALLAAVIWAGGAGVLGMTVAATLLPVSVTVSGLRRHHA
ncbi:hypothetical protein [uncultured Tessaracoccus sp.]|uniref:hypothetical protein n=1 Tax=uncultured Tessaracoccus sp. TaxID=905023 RepID=UPI0025F1DF6B|nr:hypothetical protein [uncultured Tessaracoccus sp.]